MFQGPKILTSKNFNGTIGHYLLSNIALYFRITEIIVNSEL